MITFSRSGCDSYFLRAKDRSALIMQRLAEWGLHVDMEPERAMNIYGSKSTRCLVFFEVGHGEGENSRPETYVSENAFTLLLCKLVNDGLAGCIDRADPMHGFIMMRLLGDMEEAISVVNKDLRGEVINRDPLFRRDIPATSSIIYFTRMPLNKSIPVIGMYKKALLIHDKSKAALVEFLSMRGMDYLGSALGTPDWNAIEIKIYDANGFFDLHRRRLWLATEGLQIGLVLEEQWGKDQALVYRSVPIYMLKIFTPVSVQTIKQTAIGLEYDCDGQRFADFDVFYNERKVSTYTELETHLGMTRNDLGVMFRNKIIRNMDPYSRNEFFKVEEELRNRLKEKVKTES